jgi:hypothetical protein
MLALEGNDMGQYANLTFSFTHEGLYVAEPKAIKAKDVGADFFTLLSSSSPNPSIQVRAEYPEKKIERHPWFETKWPPTVMFSLYFPTVFFLGHAMEIKGMEDSNMMWAGMILPPYDGNKGIQGVKYTNFRNMSRQNCATMEGYRFQQVRLW